MEAMMALADLAGGSGDVKKWVEWLERARKARPDAIEPRSHLAMYYVRQGDRQRALAVAQEAAAANPDNITALQMLATVQAMSGDPNSAVSTYNRAAALRPKSALVRLNLAAAQLSAGNAKEAEATYRKALAMDPNLPEAQAALAALLLRTNRPAEALKLARDLQQRFPRLPTGAMLESDILFAQKNYAAALKAAEAALALRSSGEIVVKAYAAQARGGDVPGALARLSKWVAEHPDDNEARSLLADGLVTSGNPKAAIEHYEYLRKKLPGDALPRNNLANALQQLKDPRALEVAEEAYKLVPGNPLVADTLGWILVERGDLKRGLELIRQAAAKLPDMPEVRYHLAVALAKSGDNAAARREVQEALKSGKPFPQQKEARELLSRL